MVHPIKAAFRPAILRLLEIRHDCELTRAERPNSGGTAPARAAFQKKRDQLNGWSLQSLALSLW
jgi:hypothetical protein